MGATFLAACAHKVPEVPGSEAEAHVSWSIGAGGDTGDALIVCQAYPRWTCEVGRTTARTTVRSSVHLYLHAGDTTVTFAGRMRTTFLSGAPPDGTRVDSTVAAKGKQNLSTNGIVVDKPGTYELSISLVAKTAGGEKKIEDRVDVLVR